jgi:hypothetical protein
MVWIGTTFLGLMVLDVLTAVLMNSIAVWNVSLCQILISSLCFRGAHCPHCQGLCICNSVITDMETVQNFEDAS